MKRESAKQIADERQRRTKTTIKIFLKAKGWIPMRTMLVMAGCSTGHAKWERDVDGKRRSVLEAAPSADRPLSKSQRSSNTNSVARVP